MRRYNSAVLHSTSVYRRYNADRNGCDAKEHPGERAAALAASEQLTGCECQPDAFPFVCPRHGGCEKTEHYHLLCRTQISYFEGWERGIPLCLNRGPTPQPFSFGLGDLVHWAVKLTTFGLLKPGPACKCHARRAWLNHKLQFWPIRWPWRRGAR